MKDVIFFGWADIHKKREKNEKALCINDDSGVSFKKGHSRTARHAHAMLYAQRSESLSKNYSTHADAFFTDE
jgi:hypothetical protein